MRHLLQGWPQATSAEPTNFETLDGLVGGAGREAFPGTVVELYIVDTQMGGKAVQGLRLRAPRAAPKIKAVESENPADFNDPVEL